MHRMKKLHPMTRITCVSSSSALKKSLQGSSFGMWMHRFAIATDQVCQSLEHVLIRQNPGRLLYLWINNVRKGFVNTVLRVSTVLNWASLVLWISYLSALFLLIRRGKHKSSASCRASEKNSCNAAEECIYWKKHRNINAVIEPEIGKY